MTLKTWLCGSYLWATALSVVLLTAGCAKAYDPLALPAGFQAETVELSVSDSVRKRNIPIFVYLPPQKTAAPVILFSHGLGGSRHGSSFLGRHWAARGYLAVFLQHPGSDDSVWKTTAIDKRREAMQQAAGAENFLLRVKDVPAVLDQLKLWNSVDGHVLHGRADLTRVGMSGHSFGAVTTQAVSGQSGFKVAPPTDPRIKAAIAFSPSSPRGGAEPDVAFGSVKIPWMVMTGTKDLSLIGNADLESRYAVFPALPPDGKYELILKDAEHSVFTDRALPGDRQQRNPNHHRVILALSTAFWDAWLRGDAAAKSWLDGKAPRALLEKEDRWQRK